MFNLNIRLVEIVSFHGCLLAASVIFVIPFLLYFSYKKIRPKFSVKVECWFCGRKNTVPYGNRNCWDCLSCDQYNGFKNDGDYNKPIPAQYDEKLNFNVMTINLKRKKLRSWSNGLCAQCNSNQVVKMKMLSAFVPVNAEKEDEEYQNYIHHLDKLYCLCWHCDIHTQKFLAKQDAILRNTLPPKYSSSVGDMDSALVKPFTLPKATYIFMIISLLSLVPLFVQSLSELQETRYLKIFNSIGTYLPQSHVSLFIGFISTTLVVGLIGKDRWQINDALLTLFWVTLQVLYSNELLPVIHYKKYVIYAQPAMTAFIWVFSLITYYVKIQQLSKCNRKKITTFKLKKPNCSSLIDNSSSSSSKNTLDDSFSTDEDSISDPLSPLDVSLNAVHITPPNEKNLPYRGDIGYEFEVSHIMKNSYPIVRPARFNPKSVTHSSWVAGGFWSLPSAYDSKISSREKMAMNYAMAGYQSSGLFTPPPSVTGSQESRATSAAGSYCNGDWQSSSAASVRSWPPSFYSERVTENSYGTHLRQRSPSQASQTSSVHSVATMTVVTNKSWSSKNLLKFLIAFCVSCSVLGNVIFLNYYLTWPIMLPKYFINLK